MLFFSFSIVKSMNDYVQDTNQQQLEARNEIADYVKMLELQLQEVKKNRSVSINEPDGNSDQLCSEDFQQYEAENADLRDDYAVASQVAVQSQSENISFEHYLRSSQSDFADEEGGLEELSDHDPFEATEGQEDLNLASCFQSSIGHLIQPDNVRMARITTIDGFVSPHAVPRINNLEDSRIPKRPPRKTSAGKRRKLPEVARKLSIENAQSTDSAVTHSDETASITSFESQISSDAVDLRRASHGGSNRRLPSVPSGEEMSLTKVDVAKEEPVLDPPNVTSIYKGKSSLNNHRHDSGLGESMKTSPVPHDNASHRFSLSNLRKKFNKGKTSSGMDINLFTKINPDLTNNKTLTGPVHIMFSDVKTRACRK